jgi:hypothetical protein
MVWNLRQCMFVFWFTMKVVPASLLPSSQVINSCLAVYECWALTLTLTYNVQFSVESLPHTRETCWANRLAWRLYIRTLQLCIFTAHVGKTPQQQHNWQNRLHFPPFYSKSHEETMFSYWVIESSSSALSSPHPQTLRFFTYIFLKVSRGQILTKTIRTREKLADLAATRMRRRVLQNSYFL